MANFLKNFFSPSPAPVPEDTSRRASIAACVLLIEIARSDEDFAESEREAIRRILTDDLKLSPADAAEIFETASREQQGAIETSQFADAINDRFTHDEKLRVMEMAWKVIYADRVLEPREDQLAHKLAYVLRLTHKELIDAKMKVKGEMGL